MSIKNISHFEKIFNVFAPSNIAPFEYSGIIRNSKPKKGEIRKISLALDLTTESVQKAIKQKSDLLIVFHAPDELNKEISWHRNIKNLTDGVLILYKAHLRLNFCSGGVNDVLCKICAFNAQPLNFLYDEKYTLAGGIYKVNKNHTLVEVLKKCKALKSPEIRVYNKKSLRYRYKNILISSGSGFKKELFEQFKPDMIISGEIKHGIVYLGKEYGTTLIEITHWASEDRPLRKISETLTQILHTDVSYISLPLDMQIYIS